MKFKDAQQKSVEKLSSPAFSERVIEEDETMLKHLGILKEINSYGYITTESQAGRGRSYIYNKKEYEVSEKAYISGFMLESHAVEFIKHMAVDTDKNAAFLAKCDDNVYLPASLDIPLTITISKVSKKIVVDSHMSTVLPNSVWEMYRKELDINKNEKIVFVQCWDAIWNRNASGNNGLFKDALKILKTLK